MAAIRWAPATVPFLVVLATTVCLAASSRAIVGQEGSDDGSDIPSSIHRRASADEMEAFYNLSLHLDLAHWRGRQLTMARDFAAMWAAHKSGQRPFGHGDTIKVVLLHNSRWLLPDNPTDIYSCQEPCYTHHRFTQERMNKHMQRSPLPDALFFYNAGDYSMCAGHPDPCSVPMLTHIKQWSDELKQSDILVPQLLYMPKELHSMAWASKEPAAIFRGTPYCDDHGFQACSRVYLAYRCRFHNVTDEVDVGLTQDYAVIPEQLATDSEVKEHGLYKKLPELPIAEHARYRWLINLDGITASFRLGQLLHINSVVLKMRSRWIEYYYRALQVGRHYLQFWTTSKDDIFELVPRLNRQYAANASAFHEVARQGQQFASLYLSPHARYEYWRAAVLAYRELLPDMDEYVAEVVKQLRREGKLQDEV